MATEHADIAIESFLDLERRFEAFVRAVPITPEHNRVHSPILGSILLDACSLLESVLKSSMDNARYNGINNIANIRAMRYANSPPFLNIGHLRTVFKADMLYSKPVWYLPKGETSRPWYVWRNQTGQPSWWHAYNALKHSRFQNASQATLLTTLHALKGVFLALVQSLDYRPRLIDRGLLRCSGIGIQYVRTHVVQWEPIPVAWQAPIVIRTTLFGYKYLATGSPAHATDPTIFL